MMGEHRGNQQRLFYSFNLDEHVPADHLLRGINQFLDLTDLRSYLAPFYSHTGRPSVDPELMIRMLIVGYCFGIRSERRLCEEVHLNLAYRWFCRLGLEDAVPEHSTFSKNRHGRFRESDAFRHVFETVLERCMSEGLLGAEGFAIDASVVKADAARASAMSGAAIDRLAYGPAHATRAVREYLEGLEAEGRPESARKNISVTDPAAEWTCAPGGPAFFAYSTNYLVDVRAGVIVDVEATSAHRSQEVGATRTMIDRVERRFGIKPGYLIGDTAYGNAATLGWLVNDKQIDPYIPVWSTADRREEIIPSSDFTWDERNDEYRCPGGQRLRREWRSFKRPRTHITKAATIIYRASQRDCASCPMKQRCCPHTPFRKLTRSIHEQARDVAREMAKRSAYSQSRRDRKKVEMLFAHFKRILKMDRLRLRGITGARDEFLLAAIAQNLRRMAKRLCLTAPSRALAYT
jgi:transposase